ncbi:glycosyltransferase family 9 protein [Castellaniella sp. S9]|uniref:glycosyltransferase family 9 protein n=1 Tax=Castellaniella sp. S9 TaxID=2993652 RepID=UPI0022B2CE70|nr:glycosyltransferase family 9 protein [Castellaniella sp. S9]
MIWRAVFKRFLIFSDWILSSLFSRESLRVAPPPKAVLFANLGHLGDCVISTAVISRFHSIYPDAKLGVLCSESGRLVFSKLEYISDIHVVDHWSLNRGKGPIWVKILNYIRQSFFVRRAILEKKYDIGIDLRSFFGNAHIILWISKIGYILGFRVFPSFVLSANFFDDTKDTMPEAEVHLELLRFAGLLPAFDKEAIRYDLGLSRHDNNNSEILLAGRYVVFHPISGHPSKNWDMQKWCDLVDYFIDRSINVVFTGTEADRNLILKYIEMREGVFVYAGIGDWNKFLATIMDATLVVTVDTVASHIASALNVPVVVIFSGGTSPKRWGPLGDKNMVVTKEQRQMSRDNYKRLCFIDDVVEISVSEVIRAISRFID